jgi:outer membrane protein assembly factor BamB
MKRAILALGLLLISSLACGLFRSAHEMGPIAQPVWESAAQAKPNSYIYANGVFYTLGAKLSALDEVSGKMLWQAQADSYRLSADQKLVYVSSGGDCLSLDAGSGKKVRTLPVGQSYLCNPARLDDSPYDFMLNDNGSVSAADVSTGKARWTTPLGLTFSSIFYQPPGADPYVWRGRVIVHTLTFQQDQNIAYLNFQALDPSSGKLRWGLAAKPAGLAIVSGDAAILAYQDSFQAEPTTTTHPIPVPAGPFQLVARDLATGEERWHVVTEYADGYYVRGNSLYQCRAGNWRWFDAQTGTLLGQRKSVATSYTYSCPGMDEPNAPNAEVAEDLWLSRGVQTSADNTNFENPIQDSWYTAFQLSTGKALWSTQTVIHGAPSIVALGKSVVLMLEGDKLRAYRLAP